MSGATILVLAADPFSSDSLSLLEERSGIQQRIRSGQVRIHLEPRSLWPVDLDGLHRALQDVRPAVVYFTGHGSAAPGLMICDDSGRETLASGSDLHGLFSRVRDVIRIVMLNACYCEPQALSICEAIDCVVAIRRPVGDVTSRAFAGAFYEALRVGTSVTDAFTLGSAPADKKIGRRSACREPSGSKRLIDVSRGSPMSVRSCLVALVLGVAGAAAGCDPVLDVEDFPDNCRSDVELEPNDEPAMATPIEPGSFEASICPGGESDFFAFSVDGTQDMVIEIMFQPGLMDDLELELYDAATATLLIISTGGDGDERIERSDALSSRLPAGSYLGRVYGRDASIETDYEFTLTHDVDGPAVSELPADREAGPGSQADRKHSSLQLGLD
jgi:CHAT domain